jgi:uncharacterized protein YndB with AHSA1/START domain
VARLGAAKDALTEWAIRRTMKASGLIHRWAMSLDVRSTVTVAAPPEGAFASFTERLGEWWPPEYTWSQQKLEDIGIEPGEGGMCFEIGPHGFRCDWGRVLAWQPPRRLVFTWQISPARVPDPDPDHASEVEVSFAPDGDETRVDLLHSGFERHGEGAESYSSAMGSEYGWPLILARYAELAGAR